MAILLGLSKEFEEGIAPLQEAEIKIKGVIRQFQEMLSRAPRVDPRDPDPDATFYNRHKASIDCMLDLEEALQLMSKFTKGVLKYD